MDRVFVYLAHSHRAAYEAAGWEITPLRLPHGIYSCLGEWVGAGAPVFPKFNGAAA